MRAAVLAIVGVCLFGGCKASPTDTVAPAKPSATAVADSDHRVLEMVGAAYEHSFVPTTTRKDPTVYAQKSSVITSADDFVFVLSQGGAFDGENVLEVDAKGSATFVFSKKGNWRRATFVLSADQLKALREKLAKIDVFALDAGYVDENVSDGTSWYVQVQAAGQRKTVGCANAFPPAMVELSRFVRTQIIDKHENEVSGAAILSDIKGPYHPPRRW